MANTTSASTDQISELYDWTDEQCLAVYVFSFCHSLPCPSSLFIAIRRITRLRAALAAGAPKLGLVPTAELIALNVLEFSPDDWVETYSLPIPEVAPVYALAFKLATVLYALLSLPPPLSRPFAQHAILESSGGSGGISAARIHYRKLLWNTIFFGERGLVPSPPGRMCWPLAVLGAACHDGTAQDHTAIVGLVKAMCGAPPIDCGPALLLETLPRFWASGKTAWDDCFATPIHTWIWSISSYIIQMRMA
ncbi:fungal specific transcription factor domain-containing protein [Cordyceps javanica]|nr:fungal specific transcription factor domain-containing protein [Cordyceps javanica]